MPPETIAGRYRIDREIGRGGMGSVWLATDDRLDRSVAVKQVGHLPGESVPDLARALREARSSAALNHRNVVAVYDAVEEGDHIWLVMEYVPGRTLTQVVADEGPMRPERAAWIGAQVADGLAAAHRVGTVHRDVKPGNILITDDDLAKISDFGIARTLGEEKLTQSGLMTGTPAYFSPELARGEEPAPASDVWALGATLYAAVEGRTPYADQRNALAQLATIASEPPREPERAGPLAEPIRRMMDPDPASRWAMADCAHTLHRIHEKHAQDGTREQTAAFAAVPVEREPEPAPDPTPTPTATPTPTPTPAPTAPTPARDRRRRPLLVVAALALLALVAGLGIVLAGQQDEEPTATDPSTGGSSQTAGTDESTDESSDEPPAEDPTTAEATPEPASTPAAGGGAQGFIEDYYAVLPDDTESGWSMLSPGYQDETGSYDDYDGFWSTIDEVAVDDTQPAGAGAVDVTLTYTTDGSSEQEVRRIEVERTDDGYLITGDQVVG